MPIAGEGERHPTDFVQGSTKAHGAKRRIAVSGVVIFDLLPGMAGEEASERVGA
jgi:hypothetical protein